MNTIEKLQKIKSECQPAETKTITVQTYRDPEGNPTCARDFETGAVCQFYRTQRLGCHETCVFAAPSHKGITQAMERRGKLGFLIPLPNCPLWNRDAIQTEKEAGGT